MYFLEHIKNQFFSHIIHYQENPNILTGEDTESKIQKPEDVQIALESLKDDIKLWDLSAKKMSEYAKNIQEIHTLINHIRSKIQSVDSVNNHALDQDDLQEISDISAKQYELKRTLFEFDEQVRDIERTLETIGLNRLSKQELKEFQTTTNIDFLSLPIEDRLRFITVWNIDSKTLKNQEFQGIEFTFTYDGVFNEELYIRTTAWQVLPDTVRQIKSGSELFIRKWLNGEFLTQWWKRLKIHEGTKIDIQSYASENELDEIENTLLEKLSPFSQSEKWPALVALKKGIDPKFYLLLFSQDISNTSNQDIIIEDRLTDIARYEDEFMDYFPWNVAFEGNRVSEAFAGYIIELLWKDSAPFVKEYWFDTTKMKKFTRMSKSPGLGGWVYMENIDIENISPEKLQETLHLKRYIPKSREAVILFTAAAQAAWLPKSWAKNPKLHHILQKESAGWQVGILNYTITRNTGYTTDSFRNISMQRRVNNPIWVRSTASWLGQLLLSNVDMFYPDGRSWIGDPLNEAVGMMRYIRHRYGDVDTAYSVYGKTWTYIHAVTWKQRSKTFKEWY